MYDDVQALAELRLRVGDMSPNATTQDTLRRFYASALERLAQKLKWNIPLPTTLTIPAQEYRIPMPDDLMQILWVECNGNRITPDSVNRWIRDRVQYGVSTVQATTPSLYAMQGRRLLFYPVFSADTEIVLSYIAHSPRLQPGGITGLPWADLMVAVYDAAAEYLSYFPGDTPEAQAKAAGLLKANLAFYARELEQAEMRWLKPEVFQQTRIGVGGRRSFPAK